MFFGPSALQLRSKIDKKAFPDRVEIKYKSCQHLDANLDRFGSQLGSILGGFWRPSWIQVGTKWHQNPTTQPIKKIITFWKASGTNFNQFLVDFGSNLGGPGGSNEPAFWWLVGSWSQDAPKTPPRALPEAPRAPKSQILVDFWWIFGWFSLDFCLIFMRFLIHFLVNFWSGALVVWCVFSLLLCWLVGLLVRCFAGFLVCWLSVGQLSGPTVPGTVAGLARRALGYIQIHIHIHIYIHKYIYT